eukprot:2104176-Rhodomonas_salina.3
MSAPGKGKASQNIASRISRSNARPKAYQDARGKAIKLSHRRQSFLGWRHRVCKSSDCAIHLQRADAVIS